LAVFGYRRLRRAAVIGGIILAATGLTACSALTGWFNRSPDVTVDRTPDDDKPKVEVTHLEGKSSIPVLVNDQPITRYDITQRAALMRIGGAKGGEKAATEELIDETLKMYEAAKRGVSVPDRRVDAAYASIAENLKMTPEQLTKALASQGIDDASLKKRLRAQMTWEQLVVRRTQLTAQVKAADVTEALRAKGNPESMTMTEYMLQQIVFVVPSGSPSGLYAQRRREAEAFRSRFQGCDHSLEQAKELRGVVVKEIGRRDSNQLRGPEGDAIQGTSVGHTAPPVQTDQGVELIAVCSSRAIHSTAVAQAEVQSELVAKQSQEIGKEYLQELRDRAIIEYR
jgi:peptidyl-prolyl cis-trans isomerase SurA